MKIIKGMMPLVAALVIAGMLVAGTTSSADAHERRDVANGKYTFVVGFLTEPALLEEPNGIDLRITDKATNTPVEGADKTLKADIVVGGQTKSVPLRARFGQPGAYTADIFPTKTGTWTFRFYGDVGGTQIDERFESGPGRFNDVQAKADIAFPAQTTSIGDLAAQVQRPAAAAPAPAATSGEAPIGATQADVQRALDKAESARTTAISFGIAGVAVGLIGLAVAGVALSRRRPTTGRGPEPV